MKGARLIMVFLLITNLGFTQTKPQIDITFGGTQKAIVSMGVSSKNISGYLGFYFASHGVGRVTPVGISGINYSSVSDDIITTKNIYQNENDYYGLTIGLSLNSKSIFDNIGSDKLYFICGVGFKNEYSYQTDLIHYVFNYVSDEYAYFTYLSKSETSLIYEFGMNYNLIETSGIVFGVETTYITGLGISARGFMGYQLTK